MIKTILVPVSGDAGDAECFDAALIVARAFAAHIDALHVRVDPVDIALAATSEPGGAPLIEELIARLEQNAVEREAAALRAFEEFCSREKLRVVYRPDADGSAASAQFHIATGDETGALAAFGQAADLIVAGRVGARGAGNRSLLEAALLETGRPLLITGGRPKPAIVGGVAAIAWKPTPQAARAVAAAMPFLARASEIVIMTVAEEEEPDESAGRLARNLAWHGLRAGTRVLRPGDRGAPETLLAAAQETAGLLVMGGYGHSRLREWVFGGFTDRVLEEAPLPVLLAH